MGFANLSFNDESRSDGELQNDERQDVPLKFMPLDISDFKQNNDGSENQQAQHQDITKLPIARQSNSDLIDLESL